MISFRRLPSSVTKPLLIAGASLVIAGGFALAIIPTSHPVAKVFQPQTSPVPSSSSAPKATPTPDTGSVPAVAGASTIAPQATRTPDAPAPAATPAATSLQPILLTLSIQGAKSTFPVGAKATNNPCTILYTARDEHKISSVTIKYFGQPLYSDYVTEINGFRDNWVYMLKGSTTPFGCSDSRATLYPGDSVTWKFD